MVLAGTGGPAQWPCLLKPVNVSAFSMRAKVPLDVVASSFGIAIVSSAEEAWAHMRKHSLTAGTACRQGDRVLPGWELQEMVRGRTEWSKVMLVDRGTIVMQTTMVAFLSRDWGVYPTQSFQSTEAKRHPNTSKFFRVLKEVHGVPQAVVDRASPTLFRALRAVLTATTVSGIVNVNYKVRADGTPALLEMNAEAQEHFATTVDRIVDNLSVQRDARDAEIYEQVCQIQEDVRAYGKAYGVGEYGGLQ